MQINAYSPSSVLATQQGATGTPSDPAPSQAEKTKTRAPATMDPAVDTQPATATTGDTVSLRKLTAADIAALDRQAANDSSSGNSAMVYAEVWKDGVKVGQVYSDGRVQSIEGMTAELAGTGILSAQTRAHQLASQVGGEVRYPGQTDAKSEKVRAQLRAAYGV